MGRPPAGKPVAGVVDDMEMRLIIAYALCATMVLIIVAISLRHFNNRKKFKVRQSGRGKNVDTNGIESVPAE